MKSFYCTFKVLYKAYVSICFQYCVLTVKMQLVYKGKGSQCSTRIVFGPGIRQSGNLAICTQISRFYFLLLVCVVY